jgi:hypothetical protein
MTVVEDEWDEMVPPLWDETKKGFVVGVVKIDLFVICALSRVSARHHSALE